MRSYLKTGEFTLPDGEVLGICELSAGARFALQANRDTGGGDLRRFSAIAVQYGCPVHRQETVEAIMDAMPDGLLNEIASTVLKLSGISVGDEAQAEKN